MSIAVTCSHCHAKLNVRDDMAGLKGKCPKCGGRLRIPASNAAVDTEQIVQELADTKTVSPKRSSSPVVARREAELPVDGRSAVLAGFRGSVDRVPTSAGYRLGVFLAVAWMVAIAIAYYLLIAAAAVGLAWYAAQGRGLWGPGVVGLGIFVGSLVLGGLLLVFLLKPLLAPAAHRLPISRPVSDADEPLLYELVGSLCEMVRAPHPERIELNCETHVVARPPSGWQSPFSRRLVLTIGMPLVAGLSLEQLAGVIAHEMSLFTRGSGKRRAHLIRRLSQWLQRLVCERDAWDLALERVAGRLGPGLSWLLLPIRVGVWLGRLLPRLLMLLGHLMAGSLMRQMELTADQYQARVAGSDTFEATCKQRILLQFALQGAHADLEMLLQEKQLADNLPRLVVTNVQQQETEVRQILLDLIDRCETGPLDPRSADKQRIAAAQAEQSIGAFRSSLPASVLFANFDRAAREVTLAYYRDLFGPRFHSAAVHRVQELVATRNLDEQAADARKRFFHTAFDPLRPLRLPAPHLQPPAVAQLVQTQLRHQRQLMLHEAHAYEANNAMFAAADKQLVQCRQALGVFQAGLQPRPELFATSFTSREQARDGGVSAQSTLDLLASKMEPFESSAGRRLHSALTLLHYPPLAQKINNATVLQGDAQRLLAVVSSVNGHLESIHSLRSDQAQLTSLAEHVHATSAKQAALPELQRQTERVASELQELYELFEHVGYPFASGKAAISVARHLLPDLPPSNNLQAVVDQSQEFLDKLQALNGRCIDRLCAMAEQVEQTLDVEPLGAPVTS